MKVIQLNHSDIVGGAARAAYRVHKAIREIGIDSQMWVDSYASGDWTVHGPKTALSRTLTKLRASIGGNLHRPIFNTANSVLHSPSIIPSGKTKNLNNSDADLIHLHWVQGQMLSIAEIGRLRKPVIWTLHDMWAFCGAEHYTEDSRWHEGYLKDNRPDHEAGFDLNRYIWKQKQKHWRTPLQLVAPSNWLAECVRKSKLMENWPISVIHNPIDLEVWKPLEQSLARDLLGLPQNVPMLLFGAMDGGRDPRKGFDLLEGALHQLQKEMPQLQLVVYGEVRPKNPPNFSCPVNYIGRLHDDLSLRILYAAADVFVLPSRQDNLPNTGVESLACGVPVVGFNTCGLPDIIDHLETGYLAKPFEALDLAKGIKWVLESRVRLNQLRANARSKSCVKFCSILIAEQYRKLYLECTEQFLSTGWKPNQ